MTKEEIEELSPFLQFFPNMVPSAKTIRTLQQNAKDIEYCTGLCIAHRTLTNIGMPMINTMYGHNMRHTLYHFEMYARREYEAILINWVEKDNEIVSVTISKL